MPIKIPSNLPANDILKGENIFYKIFISMILISKFKPYNKV